MLHELYLRLHVLTVCVSYAAFFAASAAAVLYLVQDSLIKSKARGAIFNHLPNLFFLDRLNYGAIGLGFPILTLSIISGFIWTRHIKGAYLSSNPREIYAVILWMVYALILHVRLSARLRGRPIAMLSLVAFSVIIFTLFASCR